MINPELNKYLVQDPQTGEYQSLMSIAGSPGFDPNSVAIYDQNFGRVNPASLPKINIDTATSKPTLPTNVDQQLANFYVYNKSTGANEPYLEAAAQPGFDLANEILIGPDGQKYVGSALAGAIRANAGKFDTAGFLANAFMAYVLPGVGASIGQSLLGAGLIPAGTSSTVATAIGSGVANAAVQVAQGKPPEEALKSGVVGAAGGAVGDYLIGDPGTVQNFVTSTSANLLAGKTPEEAVKAGIVSSGAGLAGSTVAEATGSDIAGQVTAGTTAGLLSGRTGEQALSQGVGNIKVGSLVSDIAPVTTSTTVPTESQAVVSQQELQGVLSPFEAGTPADTTKSGFDVNQDISDTSGFTAVTSTTPIVNQTQEAGVSTITPAATTPTTSITEDTGGNMATSYTEDPYGYSGDSTSNVADPYALLDPVTGEYNVGAEDQNYDPYAAAISNAAQKTADQSGLNIADVLKFFKSNPSFTKSLIGTGISTVGGLLTNQANVQAAQISAQAIKDAAAQAAEAQKFRPVGVTTRFGQSQFGFDPTTGQLTSAGYTVNPELKAMQDRIMALSGQGLTEAEKAAGRYAPLTTGAQGLFGLGQQYLAKSPEQAAADYMAKQQSLLAPSRERQLAQLQNQLFQTGRSGLSVGGTSARPDGGAGLRAASPEMEAYYNALAQQDAALAAQATQAGQQQVQFGAGLLGTGANLLGGYTQGITGAYSPFTTGIGVGSQLESLGQAPLDIGAQLGGRTSQAGANVGQSLFQGGLLGAKTTQAASGVSPFGTALTGLANSPEAQQALAQWLSGSAQRTTA